jgi:8-oxo-dGTP pyrophosphatase MutT (NUDIX family)
MYSKIHSFFLVKILLQKDNTFLILKNQTSDYNDLLLGWETPGGHLEPNENFEQAFFRELKEETGLLEVKIVSPVCSYLFSPGEEKSLGGVVYLAQYISGEIVLDNIEHCMYKWVTLDEIKKLSGTKGLKYEIEEYEKFMKNIKLLK